LRITELLAHAGEHEVAARRDLAFVADEEPRAREDPLQFFLVDRLAGEDVAADQAALQIHMAALIGAPLACPHRAGLRLVATRPEL
jgi:hypothetical protein